MAKKTKAVEAEPERKKQAGPAFADAPIKGTRGVSLMLQVGLISLPIKLNTGARGEGIKFSRIHSVCKGQLRNAEAPGGAYCPNCEEHIKNEEVAKGYEVSKGSFLILTPEEIDSCKPDTDKLVAIDTFVPAKDIDPIYFEGSYYLSPQEGGARAFVLIREMLSRAGKVGLGKATLYGNEHNVILRPFGNGLALHQCFRQSELGMIDFGVGGTEVTSQELKLAEALVEQMSGAFEPAKFTDRYIVNVKELVAAKQNGTAPSVAVKQMRAPVVDLMSALSGSLELVKKRRSA